MKKIKKRKASNPVAKNASKFNKAKVFADKTKYLALDLKSSSWVTVFDKRGVTK